MTIAIGGWLLVLVAGGGVTVETAVRQGVVMRGFDTAEACERARDAARGQVCLPALALVNR